MERFWACGCPIGSKTCAYQNPPREEDMRCPVCRRMMHDNPKDWVMHQ
jgi:hypothetical protein